MGRFPLLINWEEKRGKIFSRLNAREERRLSGEISGSTLTRTDFLFAQFSITVPMYYLQNKILMA